MQEETPMLYPTANRLRGMSLPDLVAALVAFRAAHGLPYGPADVLACACIMRGQHGDASWLLRFVVVN